MGEKEWDDTQNEWVALEDLSSKVARQLVAMDVKMGEVSESVKLAERVLEDFRKVLAPYDQMKEPAEVETVAEQLAKQVVDDALGEKLAKQVEVACSEQTEVVPVE